MTRCVQDFVALGNENCNAALVCLCSGSWITSSLRKIDFAAIFVLNLIQKRLTEHLCFFMIPCERLSMRLSVRFWSDASQIPPTKRTKVQSLFFSYSTDGRKSQSMVLSYARRSGLLIFQPDFYKQFHPELNAAAIQGSSYFSYDHPCKDEGVLGGCKRRYCSGS